MPDIPSYEQWMRETAGAFWESRNTFLRALDQTIYNYHSRGRQSRDLDAINHALNVYIEDHEQRKRKDSWRHSIRNRNGAVERLLLAFVKGPAPKVTEPPKPPAPPPQPKPPVRKTICPKARRVLDKVKFEVDYMRRTPIEAVLGPHERALELALVSLSTDLNHLYGKIRTSLERTRNDFMSAMDAGFSTFERLHTEDAEDVEFQLNIAKQILGAMESMPFPISAIGKVGTIAADMASVSKFDRFQNAIDVTLPSPNGMIKTITDAAEQFNDFRTLNVSPGKISNLATTKDKFRSSFRNFETSFETSWKQKTRDLDDRQKRLAYARQLVADSVSKERINALMDVQVRALRDQIHSDGQTIVQQFAGLDNLNAIDHKQVGIWITISVIADYAVSGLCGCKGNESVTKFDAATLASKRFGDKFARFLASNEVGLLELKDGKRTSAAIYADGKIPWAAHPTHIVAVLLYLDWVKRNLNPFLLFQQGSNVKQFWDLSRKFITSLGGVIASHHETHWFGHNTVTDDALKASLLTAPVSFGSHGSAAAGAPARP